MGSNKGELLSTFSFSFSMAWWNGLAPPFGEWFGDRLGEEMNDIGDLAGVL